MASTWISTAWPAGMCWSWVSLKLAVTQMIFERDQGEQVLAGGDVLVDLDAFAGDDAVFGRDDVGVAEVELGLIELGLRLLRPGPRPAWRGRSAPRPAAGRSAHTSSRPGPAASRSRATRTPSSAACSVGVGVGERGLGRVGRGYGCVKLLLADDVLLDQRLVALEIGLRFDVVGLRPAPRGHARLQVAARPAPRRRARRSDRRRPRSGCCRC